MTLHVSRHPLVQHKLATLRSKRTNNRLFRDTVWELTLFLGYEITAGFPLMTVEVETPLAKAECRIMSGEPPVLLPILRAGMGMVDSMLKLLPEASVGHIGIYRDEKTLEAIEYYSSFPNDIPAREVILLDPMLATGVTAVAAIGMLRRKRVNKIKLACLIAAPEGIERVREADSQVEIFACGVDNYLNTQAYIIPGLGDAGDRLYGTE